MTKLFVHFWAPLAHQKEENVGFCKRGQYDTGNLNGWPEPRVLRVLEAPPVTE